MSILLLIFIRNPRLGKVKTRLAHTVGDAEALRIYHILLEKTRQAALSVAADRWLFYSDFLEPEDDWSVDHFQKRVQAGHDLGERMENAFRQAFVAGAGKAVIIGSDCPDLNGALLREAFDRLDEADFVLGPAQDGGYYLLGMKQLEVSLFRNMEWSTPGVCAETTRRIKVPGKSYFLLPELTDVDTEEDWRRHADVTPSVRRRTKT